MIDFYYCFLFHFLVILYSVPILLELFLKPSQLNSQPAKSEGQALNQRSPKDKRSTSEVRRTSDSTRERSERLNQRAKRASQPTSEASVSTSERSERLNQQSVSIPQLQQAINPLHGNRQSIAITSIHTQSTPCTICSSIMYFFGRFTTLYEPQFMRH